MSSGLVGSSERLRPTLSPLRKARRRITPTEALEFTKRQLSEPWVRVPLSLPRFGPWRSLA